MMLRGISSMGSTRLPPNYTSATKQTLQQRPNVACRCDQTTSQQTTKTLPSVSYKNIVVGLVDDTDYLTQGSKSALLTSCSIHLREGSNVTIVLIDSFEGARPEEQRNAPQMSENIQWYMRDSGVNSFNFVRSKDSQAAVILGDAVDDCNADLLVLSSQVVHDKRVDANLLAEFVTCPLLLLP